MQWYSKKRWIGCEHQRRRNLFIVLYVFLMFPGFPGLAWKQNIGAPIFILKDFVFHYLSFDKLGLHCERRKVVWMFIYTYIIISSDNIILIYIYIHIIIFIRGAVVVPFPPSFAVGTAASSQFVELLRFIYTSGGTSCDVYMIHDMIWYYVMCNISY